MGEVYRARDTRLKREVAVKVLPQHVMSDASKRPQPSALFDVGSQDDIEFLVMEYLEGDTESSLEPLAWSGDSLSLH
jgi:serine/threonine protein kinase